MERISNEMRMESTSNDSISSVRKQNTRKTRPAPRRANTRHTNNLKLPTRIPKAAAWGWHHYPLCIKILILGVFCTMVSLATPFWAYIGEYNDIATFGLWQYCFRKDCTSIHDNLVQGKEVPVWYVFIQGTYFIGVATNIFSLTILTSNLHGSKLEMSVTVHRATCCFLAISIFQQFVALHTFVSYFEAMDFLFIPGDEVDFHGSFYCGIVGLVFTMATGLMVYIDEDLVENRKGEMEYDSPNYFQDPMYGYPHVYSNFEPMQVYKVHTT